MLKQKWRIIITLLFTLSFVSACGTTQSSIYHDNRTGSNPDEQAEPPRSEDESEDEVNVGATLIRLIDLPLPYQYEGEQFEETASINHSSNQGFSMYVYEGFKLESEEPGKDLIFYSKEDAVYMRIEVLSEDTDWNYMEETSSEQLKSVNKTVHRDEWAQPDELLNNAIMLHADNENEWVQILLIQANEERPSMKLTIHVSNIEEQGEIVSKLLAMANTIMLEGPVN
jgi:hypothetical protein